MQEGFATVSGNMAKDISEAFKSVKADRVSSSGRYPQYEGKPPRSRSGKRLMAKANSV